MLIISLCKDYDVIDGRVWVWLSRWIAGLGSLIVEEEVLGPENTSGVIVTWLQEVIFEVHGEVTTAIVVYVL